jgi:hypothetical protein
VELFDAPSRKDPEAGLEGQLVALTAPDRQFSGEHT